MTETFEGTVTNLVRCQNWDNTADKPEFLDEVNVILVLEDGQFEDFTIPLDEAQPLKIGDRIQLTVTSEYEVLS